ncbi:fumarylacetoacetate hydrolase family protein [Pseudonocardia sp. KRD-184]|uniref:Fumarylacetoacetate hydrolase family protein n=1 Tax=Pseudonocardia oceani TaxID=2792013 RepID=A0ABS6U414_9PSEU|nr:fumarylacetoacetate hydrolase family protein [Pseudonocardia oceani]MBW0090406.1 fumarylacetoacetate hydrolase family protein [Pseudonocardia oceani]MBW0096692.1 fumarylacetoacetate hydrolase family protein [Pseudonocardia oceani]MBW0108414.1 fumarylacetoacetate hydrolase family protein [Pseudonocardia oceani]MBW0121082.1 fumarylacetoacetate hydrolase family protein [Pseudonocardia oceani]MBW0126948.1 fumarylacetoacetate hydrolase family protein [Pseudonocardia oceani]
MKLVTFSTGDGDRPGVVDAEREVVRDLSTVLPAGTRVLDLVEGWAGYADVVGRAARGEAGVTEHPLDAVVLRAPIPEPRRNVFCVGKNYRDHVVEFGRSGYDSPDRSEDMPEHPVVFSKATTAVTGPFDDVDPHPGVTSEVDYEAELGVIIGVGGRGITREDAHRHVWGYTIVDDVTARDLQRSHKQWLIGKSLDTHCPMGPYAVTADEVVDVTALVVESRVNGEPRQSAPVKDLIFDIPELIAVISAGITLQPGDVIATGTPAGVGIGFDPPRFLVDGDVVEVTITGLGTQRNRIARRGDA